MLLECIEVFYNRVTLHSKVGYLFARSNKRVVVVWKGSKGGMRKVRKRRTHGWPWLRRFRKERGMQPPQTGLDSSKRRRQLNRENLNHEPSR